VIEPIQVNEGLNFSDDYARGIVLVGIPYPYTRDLRVTLKREYNDSKCSKENKSLSGSRY